MIRPFDAWIRIHLSPWPVQPVVWILAGGSDGSSGSVKSAPAARWGAVGVVARGRAAAGRGFSVAILTTSCSTSAATVGRPVRGCAEPSYLRAISSQYQRRIVSDVNQAREFAEPAMTDDPTLDSHVSPLVIGEAQPPSAELHAEHAVLLLQEVDDLELAGVDPARHPEDQKPHSLGAVRPPHRARPRSRWRAERRPVVVGASRSRCR